jgi:hypothetical protein
VVDGTVDGPPDLSGLHRRVREMKARLAVRKLEYRQRHRAGGAWHRLRSCLVRARSAWAVDEAVIDTLVVEGFEEEPPGHELQSPKRMVFVPLQRLQGIEGRRPIPLHLTQPLLEARYLVLEAFADVGGDEPGAE